MIQSSYQTVREVAVPSKNIGTAPTRPQSYNESSQSQVSGQGHSQVYSQVYSQAPNQGPSYPQANGVSPSGMKALEEKLGKDISNLEDRMNEKFEALHLEIIRQMQMSVEKMVNCFEKNNLHTQQLEARIKYLEEENENLKKRTF